MAKIGKCSRSFIKPTWALKSERWTLKWLRGQSNKGNLRGSSVMVLTRASHPMKRKRSCTLYHLPLKRSTALGSYFQILKLAYSTHWNTAPTHLSDEANILFSTGSQGGGNKSFPSIASPGWRQSSLILGQQAWQTTSTKDAVCMLEKKTCHNAM